MYALKHHRRWTRSAVAVAGLSFALVAGPVSASPAMADTSEGGNWDAPPTCFKEGAQVHKSANDDGTDLQGIYTYAYEYSYKRYYGNGYETRYVWVYEVQNPMGGMWEMVTAGFAHKLCGATWTQTSSNLA